MSHRQSCNRCRQQKVRCLRDDSSLGKTSLSRCERCVKAGVDCVYSQWNKSQLIENIAAAISSMGKQRSNRRSIQSSGQRGPELGPASLSGTPWFEQGLGGAFYPGGQTLGVEFADLVGQFPAVDENGTISSFNCWDANLQPFTSVPLNSLAGPSTTEPAPVSTAPSTTDDHDDSEDVDDDKDPIESLSSQLISLSRRATRAARRLARPGRASLTVSSPEVNEALEDTNTLIRIMKNITAPNRNETTLSTTNTCGLAFSALACHQYLVALFQAICDAIHRCLQTKKEQQQQSSLSQQQKDEGPSRVAQYVMVLQLLMHLINRMDRGLFQNNPSMWHGDELSTGGTISPVTPDVASYRTIDRIQTDAAMGESSPHGGLLVLVQDIVETIPNEHKTLRQVIQRLQTEMEHSELH